MSIVAGKTFARAGGIVAMAFGIFLIYAFV
jgi:hypothetical protein